MKNYYQLVFSLLFGMGILIALPTSSAFAQGSLVSGTIKDAESGESIPGVNVIVKGTSNGSVTDIDGNYSVTVDDNAVLVISYVGFETQEIAVGGRSTIDVSLGYDVSQLGEVVVIGYGEVNRGDVTGSVVAIDSDDFNKGAISTPQELLMGKVAGVVVTAPTGQPGGNSTIRIRGGSSLRASNDPLIVVDGVPLTNKTIDGFANPLATVNPNDIETFTVLKDASATAIYGSRASNGVIIITTKRGKSGQDLQVSYNGNLSVGVPIEYTDVYSGDEFRQVVADHTVDPSITTPLLGGGNTDWQKEVYRNAISTDHNVSLTGSLNSMPYRASVGYTNQNGMLKESNMERTTLSIGVSPTLLDGDLTFDINLKGMLTDNNFSNDGAIGNSISFDPSQFISDDNSPYGGYFTWVNQVDGTPNFIATDNPVAMINQKDNTSKVSRSIGNVSATYRMPFLPDLKAVINAGYDYYKSEGTDNTDSIAAFAHRSPQTNVKSYEVIGKNELLDAYLNYSKELSSIDSKLDVTAGYSWQNFYEEKENANRPWLADDSGEYIGSDTTVDKTESYLVSFFGRVNYTFKGRYLVTGTLRRDGSSKFSEDNRWGLFPSVAVAWQVGEESFLKSVDVLDELKIRAGYGITGQQDITDNDYPAIASYNGSTANSQYGFGNQLYQLWKPLAYDPNIKWEETTTINAGVDFSFLGNRIGGSFDYYKRTTDDLLNEIPVPVGTNFANRVVTNVGSLENQGYEISLNGYAISNEDMSWQIGVNFSKNENKITKLTAFSDPNYIGYEAGEIDGGSNNRVQINSVGHPTNTFYLFKQVYDADGMPIEGLYVDKTGQGGQVDGNDLNRYHLGNPAPDFMIGLSSRFAYKNFDFSFAGRLSVGNDVYNNVASSKGLYANLYDQSGFLSNISTFVEESQFFNAQYKSDFYIEDGSFFRMDNISAGYNFPKVFSDKISARVSFTVQNAFLITNYSGLDPEINDALAPGIDKNVYPRPRTYVLGVNFNF